MNTRIFLFAIFLFALSVKACGDTGCLKCNDDGTECTISDIIKGYKIENGKAVKANIDKCIVTDFEGTCLGCASMYYIDAANNKCVAVEDAAKIENCEDYSNGTTCSVCKSGFYLNANACTAVDPLITNCDTYSTAVLCSSCDSGYLLAADFKSCVANPKVSNCVAYSYVACESCSAGFVKVLNGYLKGLRSVDSSAARLVLATNVVGWSLSGDNVVGQTACETALASNCATFDAGVNVCNACVAGYYITEAKLCEKYPEEPIANCKDYSAVDKCIKCISAHYFKSSVCTAIPAESQKDNCTTYDNTSSNITCIACSANHYLSSNSCKVREKSKDNEIVNCATKNPSSDKCSACNANFYLSDDGLECLNSHANCETYNAVNKGGTLQCNKCADGFYLKTNAAADADPKTECLAGDVENCAQYQSGSATICSTCKNGYVKESGACNPNNSITGCTMYDAATKTACDKCTDDTNFNFVIEKKCSAITNAVAHCKVHSNGTLAAPECQTCNDGYELHNANCVQLTISNCLIQQSGQTCVTCAPGFAKSRDEKSCVAPLSWVTDKCKENNTNVSNSLDVKNVSCNICKEHSYPIDFTSQFVCVGTSDLVQYADPDSVITNCIRYSVNGTAFNCEQCDPSSANKLLKADKLSCSNQCGANAAETYNIIEETMPAAGKFHITGFNKCITNSAKILAQAPKVSNITSDAVANKYIEVLCQTGNFPLGAIANTEYTYVDPTGATAYPYMPNPWFKYPKITCTTNAGKFNNVDHGQYNFANDNCDYYILTPTANNYTCLRCKIGYVGTIDDTRNEITCTTNNNACQTTQLYNLDLIWATLFSCHLCGDTTKIPFIAYHGVDGAKLNTFTSWKQWATVPTTFDFTTPTTKENMNIECLANAHGTFGSDFTSANYLIDDNCALAFIDLEKKAVLDRGTTHSWGCAHCKPGYLPTKDNDGLITACTVMTNCAGGNIVDGCDTCNTNHILQANANGVILFADSNACISIPADKTTILANCWAATKNGNVADECKICKRGYTINEDGVCEELKPANCQDGHFRKAGATTVQSAAHKAMLLWQQAYVAGCSSCESSYVSVELETVANVSRNYCVASGWIQNNVDGITNDANTDFIPHCKHYKAADLGPNYECEECDTSYVISGTGTTPSGTKCYAGTSLGNCEIATSATNCSKCVNDTFGLVNNSCIAGNIANCVAYNYTANETSVKCTQCAPGFYKTTDNKCEQGLIPNCKIFEPNQPSQCKTCDDGHVKTTVGSSNIYCYPIPDELNCSDMTLSNNVAGGQVSCSACTNSQTHLLADPATTDNSTICMNFVSISNCTSYDVASTLSASTFKCNGCAEGFYNDVDTNSCVARVNKPNKCTAYHTTKDECTACGSNSYLFNSNKECKDYPKGILGCSTYSDASTCTACKAKRYLDNNACPLADPVIENCSLYSSKTVCATCESTYVLVGNECKKANALNCATYQSVDACASCGPDDGLETASGVTSCVNKTKTGCAVVNDNAPYNCDLCNGGFYLDAGECKNPTTITNCSIYASKDTCDTCDKTYALSTDKKSCSKEGTIGTLVPAECTNAKVVNTPVCSRCGPNHWFEGDSCAKLCDSSVSGCFTCDPEKKDQCFVCQSGYHMKADKTCAQDGSTPGPTVDPNPTSAGIFQIVSIMIALLAFFR